MFSLHDLAIVALPGLVFIASRNTANTAPKGEDENYNRKK